MSSHANAPNATPSSPAGPARTVFSRTTPIDVQQRGVFGRLKNRFRVALRPNLTRSRSAQVPANETSICDHHIAIGNDLARIRLAIEQQTGVLERGMDHIASAIHSASITLALNRRGGGDDDDGAPPPPGAHRQEESNDSGPEDSKGIPDPAAHEDADTPRAGPPSAASAPDPGPSGQTRANDPQVDTGMPGDESHPRLTPTAQPQSSSGATHLAGGAPSQDVPPPADDPRSPLVDPTALRHGNLNVDIVESVRSDGPAAQAPAPTNAQAANRDGAFSGLGLFTFASPGSTSTAPPQSTLFQVQPSSSERQATYDDIDDSDTFISFFVESVTDGPYLGARLCIYVGRRDELRDLLEEPSRFCHGLKGLAPRCEANKHHLTQLRIVLHKSYVKRGDAPMIDVLATVLKELCSCLPSFLAAHVTFTHKDHASRHKSKFSYAREFSNAFTQLRHVRLEGTNTAARLASFPLSQINSLEVLTDIGETDARQLISQCRCLQFLSVRRIVITDWSYFESEEQTTNFRPRLPILEVTADAPLSASFLNWVDRTEVFRLTVGHADQVPMFKSSFDKRLMWSLDSL